MFEIRVSLFLVKSMPPLSREKQLIWPAPTVFWGHGSALKNLFLMSRLLRLIVFLNMEMMVSKTLKGETCSCYISFLLLDR